MIFLLLCLTYFTRYDNLEVHPCWCKWHDFIAFNDTSWTFQTGKLHPDPHSAAPCLHLGCSTSSFHHPVFKPGSCIFLLLLPCCQIEFKNSKLSGKTINVTWMAKVRKAGRPEVRDCGKILSFPHQSGLGFAFTVVSWG